MDVSCAAAQHPPVSITPRPPSSMIGAPASPPDLFSPAGQTEAFLHRFLDARPLAASLKEAVSYSLFGTGKRLRPVLAWWSSIAAGGTGFDALPAAAALEMIHCFSLIHDDLPALDNDDLRRGVPTLHKHAGEALAILSGDCLLSLAFEAIALSPIQDDDRALRPHLNDYITSRLCAQLAHATTDMITGQVHDTLGLPDDEVSSLSLGSPLDRSLARVQTIHRNKTGAIIRASCRMGAISANPPADQREALLTSITAYADALGLLFQITDDLIDVTQTAAHAGKRTGKDAAAGKVTYPSILGVKGSHDEVERLCCQAHEALSPLGHSALPLIQLCNQMARRTK